jgi:hypothetical protein
LAVITSYKMSRRKKLRIIIPVVAILFLGAFAKHRLIDSKLQAEGRLQSKEMDETSGIAASSISPDVYYVHNDSGDTSRFFAMNAAGKLLTTIYFKGNGHRNGIDDCEDVAVGPGPVKGKSYIYLGDIGDNFSNKKAITVYRMEERSSWAKDSIAHAIPVPFHFIYPDGAKDAESMMVDPIEKLLYIVTKRGDTVGVYSAPLSLKANDTAKLTFRTKLFFPGIKPFKWVTAADISKKGDQILVKSYEKVYYWRRRPNESVWQAMQRPFLELKYKQERQGEAIGFTPDGKGYYTTSEGVYAPIYYYETPPAN